MGPPLWSLPYLQNATEPHVRQKLQETTQTSPAAHLIPSIFAIRPLGFRAELATDPESEQSRSYQDLEADGPDSTAVLDKDIRAVRIVSQENKNEDQDLAVAGVSTPGAAVGGTGVETPSERF